MEAKFIFLGTGASAGIPVIGCHCPVCCDASSSAASHNRRLRSSGLIQIQGKTYLIDVGPDFRAQALAHHILHIDAVLLTHAHADHTAGIDDLRPFYFKTHQKIPCFLSEETLVEVRARYQYLFHPSKDDKNMTAQIDFRPLDKDFGEVEVEGETFHYFTYSQGGMKVTGFRWNHFAYVSDIKEYSEEALLKALAGVEILVVSAQAEAATAMHFGVDEAVAFSEKIGAKQTYLTHISHRLEHDSTNKMLPSNVHVAYDGLIINL